MKVAEREKARRIRSERGASIGEIAEELGVARSSVSVWVRGVELTSEQHAALAARNPALNGQRKGQEVIAVRARAQRRAWQQAGRTRAGEHDPLHLAGCMLYWAEGTKHRHRLCFVNSELPMMRLFLRFVRECYSVPDDLLRFSVNCYLGNDLTLEEIETRWLVALGLSHDRLLKAAVNRPSRASLGKRRTLPYGTGRLVVHSTEVAQSVYGAIQEYGGFESPEWLG